MQRLALGVGLASVALFVWGFLYWGLNPLPYSTWKQTADDAAAQRAVLEHFPETGTYYLPGLYNDAETRTRLHEAGPIAFLHLTDRDGRPEQEPAMMARGMLLNLVSVTLMALLLRMAALPTYGGRVGLVALAGFAAAVLIDVGDSIWWYIPIEWKLHQAVYTFTAWLVPGLVLARFVVPEATGKTD